MRSYSRPLRQSSRVRHFAAGLGAAFLLIGLTAASTIGIAPMDEPKGIMDLTIDVQDVPCDEPYDENERVLVEPDTLNGQIRMHVIVRNRDCCCCGSDDRGKLGLLQRGGTAAPRTAPVKPASVVSTPVTPAPKPTEVLAAVETRDSPLPLASVPSMGLSQGAAPVSLRDASVPGTRARAGVPWWIALASAPAIFLFGRDSGEVCEDDETGAHSGPSRTC